MKLLFKFSLGLIVLLVITVIGVAVFINPNDYKPTIIELVKKNANVNLALPGNLSWSFYPSLGISVEQAELKDSQNTTDNLVIFTNATVALEIRDLLANKFKISQIKLRSKLKIPNHANLFLETNLSVALDGQSVNITNLNLGIDDEGCYNAMQANWLLKDLSAHISLQDNKLFILPITATIYNSKHVADFTLDTSSTTKVIAFNDRAENFEISDILSGFGYPNKLKGNSKLEIQLNTTGDTNLVMQQNISGNVILDINNGLIYGVDLPKMLGDAETSISSLFTKLKNDNKLEIGALVDKVISNLQNIQTGNSASTPFNRIYIDATINGSLVHNTSAVITHDLYEISGMGTINLETRAVNYDLRVTLRKKINIESDQDAVDFMLKTQLPLTIRGTFDKPIIRLDMSKYVLSALQRFRREADSKITINAIKSVVDRYFKKNK